MNVRKILLSIFLLSLMCGTSITVFSYGSTVAELVEDSWNTKASMNQARYHLGVVAANGKIYAIGGSTTYGYVNSGFVGTNECYDPKADTWVTLASMPTRRARFAIVAYQNKIYCIGGAVPDERGEWIACDVHEVYDIVTNSWSTLATQPFKGHSQAHVIDGKIFVVHGSGLHVYDPITNLWTEKNGMPDCLSDVYYVSAVVDDKIIVMGGFMIEQKLVVDGSFGISSREDKLMIYDPKTDLWREGAAGPSSLGNHVVAGGATTGLYAPQKVYVLLGASNNVYDPVKDTWSTAKDMSTSRSDFGVAVLDDILYVIGGGVTSYESRIYATDVSSVNGQYVPTGYSPDGRLHYESAPSLNTIAVVAIALTISLVVLGVLVYLKRGHQQEKKIT
jgi:N-acetylneuraminic acid mutarotase